MYIDVHVLSDLNVNVNVNVLSDLSVNTNVDVDVDVDVLSDLQSFAFANAGRREIYSISQVNGRRSHQKMC